MCRGVEEVKKRWGGLRYGRGCGCELRRAHRRGRRGYDRGHGDVTW